MFDLSSWNIAENRQWFVVLSDGGTGVAVGLYLTQAAAEGETDRQASGISSGYGSALPVVLAADAGATVPPTMLQAEHGWHLRAAGTSGDSSRILRVGPFVDLPEISHAVYRDAGLIARRAAAEIDAHTHARIVRSVSLGTHLPDLEVGAIARIQSARRSLDVMGQVEGHRIVGTPDSLVSELDVVSYLELVR